MASNFGDKESLKITKIETIVVNAEMRNWIRTVCMAGARRASIGKRRPS